ncbi:Tfp pilus assembly protein PilF [Jannaschia faecimaris]|uniref:Tfp pilus assembly protein PilF n=1 Tax=Jannaschia faecimaris TaxID=1244108 RepID=A0A1H3IYW9_9RHOB|nr:tetratricopeptide repeat protein [Jannaschia faecimaris]SDY32953.1 Tfp pilus assembly protein PilF [Jannaschia faecimaris]
MGGVAGFARWVRMGQAAEHKTRTEQNGFSDMTIKHVLRTSAAVLAVALMVSGCKSEGERLSDYLTSGQSFAQQGDHARAVIQFRNALKIDPDHADSRAAIAASFMAQGDIRQAEQEFTLLAERFPETLEFRSKLGEIALISANWRALDRQADAAEAIDAAALDSRALRLAARFRIARSQSNRPLQDEIADEALTLLDIRADHPVLTRIALDNLTSGEKPAAALPVLDAALAVNPHDAKLQLLRIRLLAQTDRADAAETRLMELAALYPNDPQIAGLLVARHMSTGRSDEAEAVLRALADGAPLGDTEMRSVLVRFIQRVRGSEAALTELARLHEEAVETSAATLYTAMDRSIRFDMGDRDGAIAGMTALIAEAGDAPEVGILKVLLARMHDRLGNRPEARRLVADVLSEDTGDVGALKLRATWAIDEERPKQAIVDMRSALSQRPRDSELMTLLAAAHEQDGNRGLALEQLANAAEVSGHAAREAQRYAMALLSEGRETVAVRVLDVAHEAHPQDLDLARTLADLRIARSDWNGVARILATLRQIDTPEALTLRTPVEAAYLLGQGRAGEAVSTFGSMLDADPDRQRAFSRLITGLVSRGDLETARTQLNLALVRRPDDTALRLLDADLAREEGSVDHPERIYRALIAQGQAGDVPVLRLFGLLAGQDRRTDADTVLSAGLATHPTSRPLRLIESNRRQVVGDRAGAIALLESLHAEEPADAIAANNLASLLTEDTSDPDVLRRAARIVAPLQGTMNPAVSDTIGWIAFRRGNAEGALPLLERAARGLPRDPAVHLRLGQVHAALGQAADARATFETVLTLAGQNHPVAQDARALLDALDG